MPVSTVTYPVSSAARNGGGWMSRPMAFENAKTAAARAPGSVDALVRLAEADMAGVNSFIAERMQSPVAIIPALADHLINAGGKRLRPLVTLGAARLAGANDEGCQKLAAAIEFIHTATLLHDDVVDASELRRGKVAAHLIWGGTQSVLVGDYLFARAFELIVEASSLRALEILARASRVIAEGEVLQLARSQDLGLTQETYLQIIASKTAELFAAAGEVGAVSANATDARCAALRDYGLNLGLAFQLSDDALDYGGDAATLGKNAGDDFRESKVTLPLLLAIQRTGERETAFWERTITRREQVEDDFRRARELIVLTGSLEATLDLAADYALRAKAALTAFPRSDWREALEALADFAVSRRA